MRMRTGVLVLAMAAGLLAACTPNKTVPNAGVLALPDGAWEILVVPCQDQVVTGVRLEADQASWWVDAPDGSRLLRPDEAVTVPPFQTPTGWRLVIDDLHSPLDEKLAYNVHGTMEGRYVNYATGPTFTLAELRRRLRPGDVLADKGLRSEESVVMSRERFTRRASRAC